MRRGAISQRSRHRAILVAPVAALLFVSVVPLAHAYDVYVANRRSGTVSVIDSKTGQVVGEPIKVGEEPIAIALTPDGSRAYVTNAGSDTVSVFDTRTAKVLGSPIPVGDFPRSVAISPDGARVYVANTNASVSVIDTRTDNVVSTFAVGQDPAALAIAPDGSRVVVTDHQLSDLFTIDIGTGQVSSGPAVGVGAFGIAIAPDGNRAYVANFSAATVSVVDLAASVVVKTVNVGIQPDLLAITPDGRRVFVPNSGSNDVSVIDTATDQVLGEPIKVGEEPAAVGFGRDARLAYVSNFDSGTVSAIDTATNRVVGPPIKVGDGPVGIAAGLNRAPEASFSVARARPGVPVALDASASKDSDGGAITSYAWAFGDEGAGLGGTPKTTHAYGAPGVYRATLTVTDDEGCSTAPVFSGRILSCQGSASASTTAVVNVAYPGVRLRCPKSAGPGGCRFSLQVVAGKPKRGKKAKAQSAVARSKVKAGHSAIVSLKPKRAFRVKLARAHSLLVRESATIGGARSTLYRRLEVVR